MSGGDDDFAAPRPRSALTRFAAEAPGPGIGHNQGPPLDPGRSGRAFAWRKARAALMPRLPLEVVRRRVARARALGLAYPDYASILLGSGRDVIGFLFTGPALVERLTRGGAAVVPVDPARLDKLAAIEGAERRLLAAAAPAGAAALFAAVAPPPAADAGWAAGRSAVLAALAAGPGRRALPADGVVMVGADAAERDWADAAALAKFIPAERYFAPRPG